ncbi:unnamed protein product [marine sediment metagenome]|uniref:Uncharacterized protein n=1 Tax=marine sediment metagenome TaxID=412755 RepID=X1L997_9ZZZZ
MMMTMPGTMTRTGSNVMSAEEAIDHILDVMAEYSLRSTANIDTLIWAISDSAESEEVDSDTDGY